MKPKPTGATEAIASIMVVVLVMIWMSAAAKLIDAQTTPPIERELTFEQKWKR